MPAIATGQRHVPAQERPAAVRRRSRAGGPLLALLATVAAAVSLLTVVPVRSPEEVLTPTRAEAAWAAQLEGLAGRTEVQRQARAEAAWATRLEGLAGRAEVQRQARAEAAWAARLEGLAGQARTTVPGR